jgi:hypothetical protein
MVSNSYTVNMRHVANEPSLASTALRPNFRRCTASGNDFGSVGLRLNFLAPRQRNDHIGAKRAA